MPTGRRPAGGGAAGSANPADKPDVIPVQDCVVGSVSGSDGSPAQDSCTGLPGDSDPLKVSQTGPN